MTVSNSSPLINFGAVQPFHLLQSLFENISIPQGVYNEIVVRGNGQAGASEVKKSHWIDVKRVNNVTLVTALSEILDEGEAEAISLADELKADVLLMDEHKGRAVALRLGIDVLGTIGILTLAKERKLLDSVKPVLDELIEKSGFWIGKELYQNVLHSVNEM